MFETDKATALRVIEAFNKEHPPKIIEVNNPIAKDPYSIQSVLEKGVSIGML
jgi:hypothetical protein